MPVTVTMPQLGETVTEGTILSWSKVAGDQIAEDEVLVEISTDKVDTEVPSPASGVIAEILVAAGETVAVGTPIAIIGEALESSPPPEFAMGPTGMPAMGPTGMAAVPPPPPPPVVPAEALPPAPPLETADGSRRAILSPVVRRLAAEHGIDLDLVPGTGEGGRITRKDVERFRETSPEPAPAAVTSAPPPSIVAPVAEQPVVEAHPLEPAPPVVPVTMGARSESPTKVTITSVGSDEVEEIPRLRRTIAEHMINAKQTAAHVWTSIEVDYESVERVRAAHGERFRESEGFSLTYLPFIARATMDALSAYPVVNSSFDLAEGTRSFHHGVNLGVAIDLETQGLLVATVRDADGQTLKGLARSIRAIAGKARDGALDPDDITGSTFTITNPGPFGSFMSAPIINLPNVAVLSTDTIAKRPAVVTLPDGTDTIVVRHIGYLGLTWDHRAFDGSTAVRFLARVRTNLETWDWDQELR